LRGNRSWWQPTTKQPQKFAHPNPPLLLVSILVAHAHARQSKKSEEEVSSIQVGFKHQHFGS
jgi:hypothetical protein